MQHIAIPKHSMDRTTFGRCEMPHHGVHTLSSLVWIFSERRLGDHYSCVLSLSFVNLFDYLAVAYKAKGVIFT